MSGLCHEEQLKIGVQAARKLRPDFSDDALLALAKTVHSNVASVAFQNLALSFLP